MIRASAHVIEFAGDAGLRTAQDIAGSLRQALTDHQTVAVATDAITGADITTIQLLLAARKQAQAAGKSLTLAAPVSGPLRELLIQVGCLDSEGRGLGPDGDFWTPTRGEGKAA
jgi:multidrug resistance efflux pump